ncbi:unnamed protein product [Allacma fusca]|uniref:AB hydrolase-1 domain-containing protein n=1 Tax=Allacma fusca TaxID=39272 RepID=A0A8J2NQV5_9HEXA|nr:unnamed protein product [Allacma fusca]
MSVLQVGDQVIYHKIFGNGPHTVVLLPGFLGISDLDFGKIFPLLNKTDFRWICWDPPGYGRSRPQDLLHDENVYRRSNEILREFMKELGCDKYSIVGWSQGGTTGMLHACQYPENVIKLIFWGSFARYTPALLRAFEFFPQLDMWSPCKRQSKLEYFDRNYLRKICLDMLATARRVMGGKGGNFLGDELQNVQCPTLILHGVKDRLTDDFQPRQLQKAFKNARIQYFPDGGHDLHLQFPEEFVKTVEGFLQPIKQGKIRRGTVGELLPDNTVILKLAKQVPSEWTSYTGAQPEFTHSRLSRPEERFIFFSKMSVLKVGEQVIYHKIVGNGSHTVVLLPGFLGISDLDFGKIIPMLNKKDFRWVCWDPPGYGRSRPQELPHDENMYQRYSELLRGFMEALECEKYSIVGWNHGGVTGMLHASHYPQNVIKQTLWDCYFQISPMLLKSLEAMTKLETWPSENLFHKLKYFKRDSLRKICSSFFETSKRIMAESGGNYLGDPLPSVECPTLILHGVKDPILTVWEVKRLSTNVFKRARIHYWAEGYHDVHLEFPEEFVEVLEEFLTL